MKTLSQKLAKNLEYFTKNPNKRCELDGKCKYWGDTLNIKTKGCFVGALLPLATRKWADSVCGMSVQSLIANAKNANISLPKIVSKNIPLMQRFQSLHDLETNWTDNGLSYGGKKSLLRIIESSSDLDEKDFEYSLVVSEKSGTLQYV